LRAARAAGACLPALRLGAHRASRAIRLHSLQGLVPLSRLPRTLRLLQTLLIMATPQFHPLRIREVRPETAAAVSVAFEVPVELSDPYRFTQGQFVTLKTHIDGEETGRSS